MPRITGDVPHDNVDAGNPNKIGGYAKDTAPTAVAAGDRVNAWFDLYGRMAAFIKGDVAHDAADSGDPVKVGGKAASALPAAVTAADRVNAYFDLNGRQVVLAQPPTDQQTRTVLSSADQSGAAADVSPAPGASKYLYIDNVIVSVGASAIVVTLKEETSGTVVAKLNCAANSVHRLGFLGKLPVANKKLQAQTSGAGQVDITVISRSE